MKRTKGVKLLLVALLAMLVFALVACDVDNKNKNDNNNSKNPNSTVTVKKLVEDSKADIDAMLNCFLVACENIADVSDMHMVVQYTNDHYPIGDGAPAGGYGKYIALCLDSDIKNRECYVYFCVREEDAIALKTRAIDEGMDAVKINNKVIVDNDFYKQIINCKQLETSTKFTQEQIEFFKRKAYRGFDDNELFADSIIELEDGDSFGSVYWSNWPVKGICNTEEGIEPRGGGYLGDEEKYLSINYTDDSFISFDEETGLVSYSLTYKPGWHIGNEYEHDQTVNYRTEYFYTDIPNLITVSNKIGDYKIRAAVINIYDGTVNSVVIEDVVDEVRLSGNIKEITIPFSEKPFVHIGTNNVELKKINFGGTMQEWEQLQYLASLSSSDDEMEATNWTKMSYHDEENDVWIHKDISFTVVCTNGSITYPKD